MLDFASLRPLQAMVAAFFFKYRKIITVLPRQEGKTELGIRLLHDLTARPQTSAGLYLAKDKRSGKKATREKFMRLFDPKLFVVNTEQVHLRACPTSSIFMDSVDKDPDRIRGGTYNIIHWSEMAFSKIEQGHTVASVFDKVCQPTLRKRDGYFFGETTLNGKNGFHDFWQAADDYGLKLLKISLGMMVEMGLITRAEYEEIQKTTHPDVFLQEYECEFVTFQGRAFQEFNEADHVDPDMPGPKDWQRTVFAIDWGYHPSATCVLFAYIQDGVVNVYDEIYAHKQLIEQSYEALRVRLDNHRVQLFSAVADHEQDRIDELILRGIPCGKADKANVQGARLSIKERLWAGTLKFHPRCQYAIRDLETAVWDAKKEGELDYSQCTYGHYDAEAALRYLLRELGQAEVDAPDVNPHTTTDDASARAFALQREHS